MNSFPIRRVGYWWSEKKSRKFNVGEFASVCRASGLELVKIDLTRSLEEQGPFAAIVHKLSDAIAKAAKGDEESKAVCEAFQEYSNNHPDVVILDPLPNVGNLLDRYRQYKLVDESELRGRKDIFIPAFVELTTQNVSENLSKMQAAGVEFPIVCKPMSAHGSSAHQMSLIFNEEGLKDVSPPCVAQKFINHNAILYKLFIIGNQYFIIERPSLKNFSAGDQKTIFFDSDKISKPHSASALTELDDNEECAVVGWPDKEKMDCIVRALRDCLGLNLFGVDVIVDNVSGHYAIVDMNIFPGYDEVGNFFQLLCDLILKKISLKLAGLKEEVCEPKLACYFPTLSIGIKSGKFSFDHVNSVQCNAGEHSKEIIPYFPKCFCCPISGSCHNSLNSKVQKIPQMMPSYENLLQPQNCSYNQMNNGPLQLHSHDYTQDDSGIETSDSCDEKKKEITFRTIRRQHSRTYPSPGFSVNESG